MSKSQQFYYSLRVFKNEIDEGDSDEVERQRCVKPLAMVKTTEFSQQEYASFPSTHSIMSAFTHLQVKLPLN